MCGEHDVWQSFQHDVTGSSPHVRGALYRRITRRTKPGIIPACAGSTRRSCRGPSMPGDHPRMCGEHVGHFVSSVLPGGSSPHVRGALFVLFLVMAATGIIPACAGSTSMVDSWYDHVWDHPRMCGEHAPPNACLRCGSGSSPHVRGAQNTKQTGRREVGIIPACAGSTPPTR